VRIKYYPIDRAGQLVVTRLLWLTLPQTEDDEHLNTILKQRAFGPPPSFRAKSYGILSTGLSAMGWMILIIMIMSVYAIFLQGVPWY
ncbi:MAG TPA: hypothetical protein VMP08_07500, partial [Anaerolineae bacterium]|nr:hypothetical protein [Anaerolineae bacterium]